MQYIFYIIMYLHSMYAVILFEWMLNCIIATTQLECCVIESLIFIITRIEDWFMVSFCILML